LAKIWHRINISGFTILLPWQSTCNCVARRIQIRIILHELEQRLAKINVIQVLRLVLRLQERNNHQEEGIRTEPAIVRFVETPNLEHLLQHENQRLNDLVLFKVLLDEVDTVDAVVVLSH